MAWVFSSIKSAASIPTFCSLVNFSCWCVFYSHIEILLLKNVDAMSYLTIPVPCVVFKPFFAVVTSKPVLYRTLKKGNTRYIF